MHTMETDQQIVCALRGCSLLPVVCHCETSVSQASDSKAMLQMLQWAVPIDPNIHCALSKFFQCVTEICTLRHELSLPRFAALLSLATQKTCSIPGAPRLAIRLAAGLRLIAFLSICQQLGPMLCNLSIDLGLGLVARVLFQLLSIHHHS